jgi:excisionase family DNA binding protein
LGSAHNPPSIPVPGDRLLNLAEAAARLHVGQSTLRQMLYGGGGPIAVKLPGSNRWRFRASDVDKFVHEISARALASAPTPR